MAAFLGSAIAVNSASVLDSAMVGCMRVRYHTVPPASRKQIPDVDRRCCLSFAHVASLAPCIVIGSVVSL